jgi:hypothetical protein
VTADKSELESSIPEANGIKINIELVDKESYYIDETVGNEIPLSTNYFVPIEIDENMNLIWSTPDNYEGFQLSLNDGYLVVTD